MTVHGVTCIKLVGSWNIGHIWTRGRLGYPAGRITHGSSLQGSGIFSGQLSRIMQAGQCRQETCSRKLRRKWRITEVFVVSRAWPGLYQLPTCARVTANVKICTNKTKHAACVSVEMTPWIYKNDYIEQDQNILKEMSVARWVVMQHNARCHAENAHKETAE